MPVRRAYMLNVWPVKKIVRAPACVLGDALQIPLVLRKEFEGSFSALVTEH